jgi:hypothetical protein
MIVKKSEPGEHLLEIDNLHVDGCGPTPTGDAGGSYLSYFENQEGEQWVFVGNCKTGRAEIRGGDAGWENVYEVTLDHPSPLNLILNDAERTWLIACFMAFAGVSFEVLKRSVEAEDPMARLSRLLDNPPADFLKPEDRGKGKHNPPETREKAE